MADIISLHSECFDFESMVGEVEILIPQYMDALDHLKEEDNMDLLQGQVRNITTYWERLTQLFDALGNHDWEVDLGINFENVKLNTLQSELESLQAAYVKVHKKICLEKADDLWELADLMLKRMTDILNRLGFDEDHEDHKFVQKMQLANSDREQKQKEA